MHEKVAKELIEEADLLDKIREEKEELHLLDAQRPKIKTNKTVVDIISQFERLDRFMRRLPFKRSPTLIGEYSTMKPIMSPPRSGQNSRLEFTTGSHEHLQGNTEENQQVKEDSKSIDEVDDLFIIEHVEDEPFNRNSDIAKRKL